MSTELASGGLSRKSLGKIYSVFKMHEHIQRAVLYGSRAKGTYRPGSDIDLTLIGENLSYQELLVIENELDDLLLPYKIDLSLFCQINDPDLLSHIQRVGKVFYDKIENPQITHISAD